MMVKIQMLNNFVEPMLAFDYEKKHDKIKELVVQPKLDGVRCIFNPHDPAQELQSRSGLTIEGTPHIVEQIKRLNLPFIVDGELHNHEFGFDKTSGIVRRKANNISSEHKEVDYIIFDVVFIHRTFESRLDLLKNLHKIINRHPETFNNIQVLTSQTIKNTPSERKRMLDMLLSAGYEGAIYRNPNGIYEHKRSNHLLREKPFDRDVFQIVDIKEEVDKHKIAKGRAGALVCVDREGQFVTASGIVDSLKDKLWANPSYYIGEFVLLKFQRRTKQSYRHPNFVRLLTEEDVKAYMYDKKEK